MIRKAGIGFPIGSCPNQERSLTGCHQAAVRAKNPGRIAQRESVPFTRERSKVRSLVRPPENAAKYKACSTAHSRLSQLSNVFQSASCPPPTWGKSRDFVQRLFWNDAPLRGCRMWPRISRAASTSTRPAHLRLPSQASEAPHDAPKQSRQQDPAQGSERLLTEKRFGLRSFGTRRRTLSRIIEPHVLQVRRIERLLLVTSSAPRAQR